MARTLSGFVGPAVLWLAPEGMQAQPPPRGSGLYASMRKHDPSAPRLTIFVGVGCGLGRHEFWTVERRGL
jgi:hypothetical protein